MNQDFSLYAYLILPFVTWFITGCTKFAVNWLRSRGKTGTALELVGYGGFPSNHSAIVSSMPCLIVIREGVSHPAFGVAMCLAFIVILDANSLRQKVAQHAVYINQLKAEDMPNLRERIGHSKIEIAGGIAMGIICAFLVHYSLLMISH